MINSFKKAREVLSAFVPAAKPAPYTLKRMFKLLEILDNPQEKYKVIHIAGTSGKTSTSYYIASLLNQAGKKVGLTVSPHVDEVNERLQMNLIPLPEKQYARSLSELLEIIKRSGIKPTYFELLIAFAYWEFARQKVDYAVVEVGLGGLLDGTNTISRRDKICVITDIDLDHTEILGDNLRDIAAQKAGIIQSGNTVFSYKQDSEVQDVLQFTAKKNRARLVIAAEELGLKSPLPLFQQRNFNLAKNVYSYIKQRDQLMELSHEQINDAQKVYIPARMEEVRIGGKTLIIDGSHNAQKIATLMHSLRQRYPNQPIAGLVSFVESEESRARAAIRELSGELSSMIITTFSGEQDTPKHSVNPQKISSYCDLAGFGNYRIIEDPKKALEALLKQPEVILLITGSFYLLNHIRPLILKKND